MANRLATDPGTKNPGGLAGHTGASNGSKSKLDRAEAYTILRSVFNDDGHFMGLELVA